MNKLARIALLSIALTGFPCFATTNAVLGWTDLRFTTQLGWRLELQAKDEEHLSVFRVWYQGKEIPIPLSAYEEIRDPVLSQVRVIELTGSDDFEIEIPAYIFDTNGNASTVRIWTYLVNKHRFIESRNRTVPSAFLRSG